MKRYKKLMLRRIDWTMKYSKAAGHKEGEEEDGHEEEEEEEAEEEERRMKNKCVLVWEGTVLKPAYNNFRAEEIKSAPSARKWLNSAGVAHYWDMAMSTHEAETTEA